MGRWTGSAGCRPSQGLVGLGLGGCQPWPGAGCGNTDTGSSTGSSTGSTPPARAGAQPKTAAAAHGGPPALPGHGGKPPPPLASNPVEGEGWDGDCGSSEGGWVPGTTMQEAFDCSGTCTGCRTHLHQCPSASRQPCVTMQATNSPHNRAPPPKLSSHSRAPPAQRQCKLTNLPRAPPACRPGSVPAARSRRPCRGRVPGPPGSGCTS